MSSSRNLREPTTYVHFDPAPGDPYAPSTTPIYQTATFRISDAGGESACAFDYTRSGNPTRQVVEKQLARIEHGKCACAFASGMAAIAAVFSLAEAGDEVLASTDLYGGTYRYLTQVLARQGVRARFIDTDVGWENDLLEALDRRPRLVFVETPTNPFQRVTHLERLGKAVRAAGSLLAVDNSLMSPYLQNPLDWGADLVIHSGTKFLSGHADVTAGSVVTRDEEVGARIAFFQNACGAGLAPFDSFLLGRGMKTLPLRVERQQATAGGVARWLEEHPAVSRVYYPGLAGHLGSEVHSRQARGAGSVIAVETGSIERSRALVSRLKLFSSTVSFGSVASTVSLPALMSHASIPEAVRRGRRFAEDLVRLSIGIEDPDDLREDLDQALERP